MSNRLDAAARWRPWWSPYAGRDGRGRAAPADPVRRASQRYAAPAGRAGQPARDEPDACPGRTPPAGGARTGRHHPAQGRLGAGAVDWRTCMTPMRPGWRWRASQYGLLLSTSAKTDAEKAATALAEHLRLSRSEDSGRGSAGACGLPLRPVPGRWVAVAGSGYRAGVAEQ